MRQAIAGACEPIDFKTRLQEACHRLGMPAPTYRVCEVRGPPHARLYVCELVIGDAVRGMGEGSSKKIAEQACAEEGLAHLNEQRS